MDIYICRTSKNKKKCGKNEEVMDEKAGKGIAK
jgi:hypothetical protein